MSLDLIIDQVNRQYNFESKDDRSDAQGVKEWLVKKELISGMPAHKPRANLFVDPVWDHRSYLRNWLFLTKRVKNKLKTAGEHKNFSRKLTRW